MLTESPECSGGQGAKYVIYDCFSYGRKRLLETANLENVTVDLEEIDGVMEDVGATPLTVEEKIERLRHLIERARETAETSHLTTSEQEETSSFVITGNITLDEKKSNKTLPQSHLERARRSRTTTVRNKVFIGYNWMPQIHLQTASPSMIATLSNTPIAPPTPLVTGAMSPLYGSVVTSLREGCQVL